MKTAFALTVALAGAPVLATANHDQDYDYNNGYVTDYAEVVRVVPIQVRRDIETPREECRQEAVEVPRTVRERNGNAVPGAIVGALIGAGLGHAFVHGSPRGAATVIGGVAGAGIGANAAQTRERTVYETEYVERCRTAYETRRVYETEGYDVTYRYHGQLRTVRMDRDPGRRIPVRVNVEPDY